MDENKIFEYIDSHKDAFIEHLKNWVSIKSVSALPCCRPHCFTMVEQVAKEMKELGCTVEIMKTPKGTQEASDGSKIELPPVLFASLGTDTKHKTVLIYGHIDVQPAEKSDGWNTEPFDMVVDGDKMIGRGTSDDKGPVLGWICMLKAFKDLGIVPAINLKFIFECMEESGSEGLDDLLLQQRDKFLKDIDFVCISDNNWTGTQKPTLTYGLRGVCQFFLEVSGPKKDLHSGLFGGSIREPMTDLISILSRLVNNDGKILVPNIYEKVKEFTSTEKQLYENITFETMKYCEDVQCEKKLLTTDSKVEILAKRWRFPSLSLHGIEGAFSQPGLKTVIPSKVIGKFSIRIVPDMQVEDTVEKVKKYVFKIAEELKIQNKVDLKSHGALPWLTDIDHPNFVAARKAIKRVHGCDPDLTREGGSIPITLLFQQITGKNIVLIPMGRSDDGPHSQNEKLNISNFITGMKVFCCYIEELSKL